MNETMKKNINKALDSIPYAVQFQYNMAMVKAIKDVGGIIEDNAINHPFKRFFEGIVTIELGEKYMNDFIPELKDYIEKKGYTVDIYERGYSAVMNGVNKDYVYLNIAIEW
jgi:hypothetical protein